VNLAPQQAALNAVEWLAALWDLCEPGPSRAANAHLAVLVRVGDLRRHDACAWLDRERRVSSRDRLVKRVVSAAYGQTDHADIPASFHQLCAEIKQALGSDLFGLICEARDEARARVEALAGPLDPVGDVAAITGQTIPMRVVIAPSVFLPPPQAGRHGVMLHHRSGPIAHLHFGFPLEQDPRQYNITSAWLMGGCWHYAFRLYTNQHWPAIAERLAACTDLAEAVSRLVDDASPAGRVAPGEPRWIGWLEQHMHLALKGLLYRQRGESDEELRTLAGLRGYTLAPWFEAWMTRGLSRKLALADVLVTLPDALRNERSDWEALARAPAPAPPTINFALASRSARRAVLVFPDDWPEPAVRAAAAGWGTGPMPVARCSDWLPTGESDGGPVIAFGEPANNALVRTVLEQRALAWPPCPSDRAALVAVSTDPVADAQWCIAVAVSRPETAAMLRADAFRDRFNTYVILDGGVVIGDNRPPEDFETQNARGQ
jgi:hypothetical protein